MHLRMLINTFYKKHLEKPIVISPSLDSIPLMTKLIVLKEPKQKHGYPSKGVNKRRKS